jgi:hypothetical protein
VYKRTGINEAKLMDVPVVTYGVVTSYMQGAIPRALVLFQMHLVGGEKLKVISFGLSP